MRYIILILCLLCVGCLKPPMERVVEYCIITVSEDEPEETYIGEYYSEQLHGWVKFTALSYVERNKDEIRLDSSLGCVFSKFYEKCVDMKGWVGNYFFYTDIPDQYQAKRDEVEARIKYGEPVTPENIEQIMRERDDFIYKSESSTCLCSEYLTGNKPMDCDCPENMPIEETEDNIMVVYGTIYHPEPFICHDFIITDTTPYTFEIKDNELKATCKEE